MTIFNELCKDKSPNEGLRRLVSSCIFQSAVVGWKKKKITLKYNRPYTIHNCRWGESEGFHCDFIRDVVFVFLTFVFAFYEKINTRIGINRGSRLLFRFSFNCSRYKFSQNHCLSFRHFCVSLKFPYLANLSLHSSHLQVPVSEGNFDMKIL